MSPKKISDARKWRENDICVRKIYAASSRPDDDGDVVCGGFGYMLDAVIVPGLLSA